MLSAEPLQLLQSSEAPPVAEPPTVVPSQAPRAPRLRQPKPPRLPDNLWPTVKDEKNPYANYTVEDLHRFLNEYRLRRMVIFFTQPESARRHSKLA